MTLTELLEIVRGHIPQGYKAEAEPYRLQPIERRTIARAGKKIGPGYHLDIYTERNGEPEHIETLYIPEATKPAYVKVMATYAVMTIQQKAQRLPPYSVEGSTWNT